MIGASDVHHEASHGDQVVPFPPPPLVLSTMAVPHDELLSLCLISSIEDFTVHLGNDEEGPVGLVFKVPQLVVGWRGILRVRSNVRTIVLVAALNVEHEAVKMRLDVEELSL